MYIADMIEETRSLQTLNLRHNTFRERAGELLGPALGVYAVYYFQYGVLSVLLAHCFGVKCYQAPGSRSFKS